MPGIFFLLLRDGESLPDTLQGWKGVSSRLIHKTRLSALNPFWQPDYFDRLIQMAAQPRQ